MSGKERSQIGANSDPAAANAKALPFPDMSDFAPMRFERDSDHVVRFLNCTANKPLHLGHLRNIALGDATAATLELLGAHVVRHTIVEDTGRFMTEAMDAVSKAEAGGKTVLVANAKPDRAIGALYAKYREARAKARRARAEKLGQAASTDYEAGNDDADAMMRALLKREPAIVELRDRIRDAALKGQQETLQRLGVSFDHCDYESREDESIEAFIASAEQARLLHSPKQWALAWRAPDDQVLKLVNEAGQYQESARLISLNARIARSSASRFRTIVYAGSEWKKSMTLYPGFLSAMGLKICKEYRPTFYGMVNLNGKKMASSQKTGVLVDDLLDQVASDPRLHRLSQRSSTGATPDQLGVLIIRSFLLSESRIATLEYSVDNLANEDLNPGWLIAEGWARDPVAPKSEPSPECRARLIDAAERRSFEGLVHAAAQIGRDIIEMSATSQDRADFHALLKSAGITPRTSRFRFQDASSFLDTADIAARSDTPGANGAFPLQKLGSCLRRLARRALPHPHDRS